MSKVKRSYMSIASEAKIGSQDQVKLKVFVLSKTDVDQAVVKFSFKIAKRKQRNCPEKCELPWRRPGPTAKHFLIREESQGRCLS